MKIALIALFLATSACAQLPPGSVPVACGPNNVDFKLKMDNSQHEVSQPAPGKAQIYFIHESGTFLSLGYPTTKVGIDGAWAGANHSNSWFSASVDPGEHHVCVTLQSSLVDDRVEFAHFQAEAGKVYFYRTRLVLSRSVELLELEPIDSDQGKYLVASFGLSVSQPKK
jgi:hypothetical protein